MLHEPAFDGFVSRQNTDPAQEGETHHRTQDEIIKNLEYGQKVRVGWYPSPYSAMRTARLMYAPIVDSETGTENKYFKKADVSSTDYAIELVACEDGHIAIRDVVSGYLCDDFTISEVEAHEKVIGPIPKHGKQITEIFDLSAKQRDILRKLAFENRATYVHGYRLIDHSIDVKRGYRVCVAGTHWLSRNPIFIFSNVSDIQELAIELNGKGIIKLSPEGAFTEAFLERKIRDVRISP